VPVAQPTGSAAGTPKPGNAANCEFQGTVSYRLNGAEQWPADAAKKITEAMDGALFYYNCYSALTHKLVINYRDGVKTAEGNVDGQITFGSDRAYMTLRAALHEVGHTMGVGYSPWINEVGEKKSSADSSGRWVGKAVVALMMSLPADQRDKGDEAQRNYITLDGQHFWPYGLNYESEYKSEWSLINHVRVVAAMAADKAEYRANRK
jgi:hypothetical protein